MHESNLTTHIVVPGEKTRQKLTLIKKITKQNLNEVARKALTTAEVLRFKEEEQHQQLPSEAGGMSVA